MIREVFLLSSFVCSRVGKLLARVRYEKRGAGTRRPAMGRRLRALPAARCSMVLFRFMPAGIRIISTHFLRQLCCFGTQILFVNGSRFIHKESHHARSAVLYGVGDEGKSC